MATLVIRGGRILDPAVRRADPADLLVADDTIVEVGPPGLPAPADARLVDATDRLLLPGLVNAHTHAHGTLSRGVGDRWTLERLLNAGPWVNGRRTADDRHLATLVGAVEMVTHGCTAAYDLTLELPVPTLEGIEAVAEAYAAVGMRAVVAPMLADRTVFDAVPGLREALPPGVAADVDRLRPRPPAETMAGMVDVLRRWRLRARGVDLAIAPTIPTHCSDELWTRARDAAAEFGVGIHTHLAESKVQVLAGLERYGTSLTAHLAGLGVLGPRFVAAHAIWLDDDDIARLADAGASVSHNAGSNLRLGTGVAPARRMLDRGVNLAIGTDGAVSSDHLNMFEAVRMAALVSRIASPDPDRWLSAPDVLRAATEGSARALGLGGQIGRIAAGYKADIVFLDLRHVRYAPLNDPATQVVFAENGTAVDRVMIGGRMVVEGGRVTTVDVSRLKARAEAAVERLRAETAEARALADRLEPVVTSHCGGLQARAYPVHRRLPD